MSINDVLKQSILNQIDMSAITTETSLFLIAISALSAAYILLIYIFTSRKGFYSSAFAKTLMGMSVITTAIILAMQASIVVSLGMVGALSIVRFRNAVKDPLDLLFLFWAISSGIICGTGLTFIALICHLAMTIILLGVDFIPVRKASYILIINGTSDFDENQLIRVIKKHAKRYKLRTKNVTTQNVELLLELNLKDNSTLLQDCLTVFGVCNASLINHDGEIRY